MNTHAYRAYSDDRMFVFGELKLTFDVPALLPQVMVRLAAFLGQFDTLSLRHSQEVTSVERMSVRRGVGLILALESATTPIPTSLITGSWRGLASPYLPGG